MDRRGRHRPVGAEVVANRAGAEPVVGDSDHRQGDQEPGAVASSTATGTATGGHLSRQFRRAYGESPYGYLMTRRIERAMALLRRGDLSVTEVCFAVGFSSLGTFSTRFSELVGVPPSTYRARTDPEKRGQTPEMPSCHAKQVTRPVRNREAPAPGPHLP